MWDIMDGFLEEVTFEQDLMEVREIWGGVFQAEVTAGANALRLDYVTYLFWDH